MFKGIQVVVGLGALALAAIVNVAAAPAPVEHVRWQEHPAFAAQAAAATGGAVTGKIKFEGTAPAPRAVRMGSDPLCAKVGTGVNSEILIVGPGNGLQNVFVYVKDGLGNRKFPTPKTPVVLDQKGCRYVPHVFGVQIGQPIQILNSDPTLHNVHALPKTNAEFNFGQPKDTKPVIKTFDKAEIGVPIRCDVHGWMNAWVGVVSHPFFAVSKQDGSFEIKGLPAGTYTLEAWHERLGTQTQKVTVDAKGVGTASFAFKPARG